MVSHARKMDVPHPRERFLIGQDRSRRWVVCDRLGLVGGFFIDRQAALRFLKTIPGCGAELASVKEVSGGLIDSRKVFGKGASHLRLTA